MNPLIIAVAAIRKRVLQSILSIVLFTVGVGVAVIVLLVSSQASNHLGKNTKGIDLVVGAKGSPLQLILCNVLHMDFPTGNIPLSEAERIAGHRLVKQALPLALGDSWKGYRLVGSTEKYSEWFGCQLASGKWWSVPMEVVLGSVVAEKTGLRVGDTFLSSHGLTESGESHGQESYRVTGILAPSGMVYDQLILTSVSSLWRVHHLPEPLKGLGRPSKLLPGMYVQDSSGVQITSVLVRFRNALGALQLPRVINEKTVMQAASPAFELSRLYSIMGAGLEVIEGFTWLVFILSAFSVFISLLGSLRERQYDLAIMRTMGATRIMVFGLVVLEGFLLAFAGTVSGVTAGHIVIGLLPGLGAGGGSSFTGAVFHPGEWYVVGAGLAAGLLSAALPAWRASRTDIHKVLAR